MWKLLLGIVIGIVLPAFIAWGLATQDMPTHLMIKGGIGMFFSLSFGSGLLRSYFANRAPKLPYKDLTQ